MIRDRIPEKRIAYEGYCFDFDSLAELKEWVDNAERFIEKLPQGSEIFSVQIVPTEYHGDTSVALEIHYYRLPTDKEKKEMEKQKNKEEAAKKMGVTPYEYEMWCRVQSKLGKKVEKED
jgi:hypothetical protein